MRFERRENPPSQSRYQNYKPYLRRDFLLRCAYCEIHEAHFGGFRNFHVDHFRPKTLFPELVLAYDNLYYACGLCNTFKGDTWPAEHQQRKGFRFVDPCAEDPYIVHLRVERNGHLTALTDAGRYTATHLRLDRGQLRRHRRRLADARERWERLKGFLDNTTLSPEAHAAAREAMREIEQQYFSPPVPYEPEDLLP